MVRNTPDHGDVEPVTDRIHGARHEGRDDWRVEHGDRSGCGDCIIDGHIAR